MKAVSQTQLSEVPVLKQKKLMEDEKNYEQTLVSFNYKIQITSAQLIY